MDYNGRLKENTSKIFSCSKKIRAFLDELLDPQSFVETDVFMSGKDFIDGSEALGEGVVTGYASVNDYPVCIAAHNAEVSGGSLGSAQAEKIAKAVKRALKTNAAFLAVVNSNGARVGEGAAMLEGYAKIIATVAEAKPYIPTVCIINGNAVGLMSMFALSFDFVFMNDGAVLTSVPPLALASGVAFEPAKAFGKDTYSKNNTLATLTFNGGKQLREQISKLFSFILEDYSEAGAGDSPDRACETFNDGITADALINEVADYGGNLELFKDYAQGVRTVFASVNGIPAGIAVTDSVKLDAAAVKKLTKFIKLLESYNLPLVTLVDSEGVSADPSEEKEGFALLCAELLNTVAASTVTKVSVITGSAIGFAYVALASKAIGFDYVLALSNAKIAPITAEAAVNILYSEQISSKNILDSREKLAEKYKTEEANPFVSAKDGFVDNIIEPALIRPYLASALTMLVE